MSRLPSVLWLALAATSLARAAEWPELVREDFSQGAGRWQPTDPAAWKLVEVGPGNQAYSLVRQSNYQPPHRSPHNMALLKEVRVRDFEFQVRLRSTCRDYDHRDLCLVFGYVDAAHFYYVHLGKKTDDHANQVFIVNGRPRTKISRQTTGGTPWDDTWHTVRLVRKGNSLAVYFDDGAEPVMTAEDATFPVGQVGVGAFDDTGDFDDLVLRGQRVAADQQEGKP